MTLHQLKRLVGDEWYDTMFMNGKVSVM